MKVGSGFTAMRSRGGRIAIRASDRDCSGGVVMGPGEIYSLRMRLVAAGYTPIPCQDGRPVLTLQGDPV